MKKPRVSVLVFPGSNCDHDGYHAFAHVLGADTSFVWHKDRDLKDPDLVLVPGGFSYGDYLRSGAIARFSPVMEEVISFAKRGGLVLGVCNGFQILLESGLLPGAMLHNDTVRFECKNVFLKALNTCSAFTSEIKETDVLKIPIAHGEGNYVASDDQLKELFDNDLVAFQYCNEIGEVSSESNPNGSMKNIAGILNLNGNVLGMMPHPERAVEAEVGGVDGLAILSSALHQIHA